MIIVGLTLNTLPLLLLLLYLVLMLRKAVIQSVSSPTVRISVPEPKAVPVQILELVLPVGLLPMSSSALFLWISRFSVLQA